MVLKKVFNTLKTECWKIFQKKVSKTFGGLKKRSYLCTTVRSEKERAILKTVLWFTGYKLRESVVFICQFPFGKRGSQDSNDTFNIFYNGEFDPGSGWTLAAGLTHASRGGA